MEGARAWINRILLGVNVALFIALCLLFVGRGAVFSPAWDGPAVVTVALGAVTVVLAAVTATEGQVTAFGFGPAKPSKRLTLRFETRSNRSAVYSASFAR